MNKFSQWILSVGNNTIEGIKYSNEEDTTWIQIPIEFIIEKSSDPIHDIVVPIYDEFEKKSQQHQIFKRKNNYNSKK